MKILNRVNFLTYAIGKLFYHRWYYNQAVWQHTTYLGVPCLKSVSDLWNYQEIIFELKPALVLELGTFSGGPTLFFADILEKTRPDARVLSIDINHDRLHPRAKLARNTEYFRSSSISDESRNKIADTVKNINGPVFVIVDSKHTKEHVFAELCMLKSILRKGDYVIVEDTNVNGHPVAFGFGDGPMEGLLQYIEKYPDDYKRDVQRETKFGFTFAPKGFLLKTA